jgi:hypothetical protein
MLDSKINKLIKLIYNDKVIDMPFIPQNYQVLLKYFQEEFKKSSSSFEFFFIDANLKNIEVTFAFDQKTFEKQIKQLNKLEEPKIYVKDESSRSDESEEKPFDFAYPITETEIFINKKTPQGEIEQSLMEIPKNMVNPYKKESDSKEEKKEKEMELKIQQLEEENKKIKKQLEDTKKLNKEKIEKIQKLEKELSDKKNDSEDFKNEIKELKGKIKEKESNYKNLCDSNQDLYNKNLELNQTINTLKKEYSEFQIKINDDKEKLNKIVKEKDLQIEKLMEEKKNLMKENKENLEELQDLRNKFEELDNPRYQEDNMEKEEIKDKIQKSMKEFADKIKTINENYKKEIREKMEKYIIKNGSGNQNKNNEKAKDLINKEVIKLLMEKYNSFIENYLEQEKNKINEDIENKMKSIIDLFNKIGLN